MVRVLVVDHDLDVADLKVDTLRRAGFEVDQCGGPTHALTACPVLNGQPCWQVEWADVLVYDVWASGFSGEELTADLLRDYPGKAIVLTSPGMDVGWSRATSEQPSPDRSRPARWSPLSTPPTPLGSRSPTDGRRTAPYSGLSPKIV